MIMNNSKLVSLAEALDIDPYDCTEQYIDVYDACRVMQEETGKILDIFYGSEGLGDIISAVWEKIKAFFRWMLEGIKKLYQKFSSFIAAIITKIKNLFGMRERYKLTGDKIKDAIGLLTQTLKDEPVEHYIEDDKELNAIATSCGDVCSAVRSCISNFGSNIISLPELTEYFRNNNEIWPFLVSKINNFQLTNYPEIQNYITGESTDYGKNTDAYEIISKIVPDIFDPNRLQPQIVKQTYDNTVKTFQNKADYITQILNKVAVIANINLEFYNKQFELVSANGEGDSLSAKVLVLCLSYIRRIVYVIQGQTQIFAKCFNLTVGELAHQFKDQGLENTYIKFDKQVLYKGVKALSPLMTLEGVNVYKLGELLNKVSLLNTPYFKDLIKMNGEINAFCGEINPGMGEDASIFVTDAMLNACSDKEVLKYICYHELGHYMNADNTTSQRISSLYDILSGKRKIKSFVILVGAAFGHFRTLRAEVRADIYIIERHIYTPAQVVRCLEYLLKMLSKDKTIAKFLIKYLTDIHVRLAYVKKWDKTGEKPPLPSRDWLNKFAD